jgi:uncharacterized membrane protein YgdD (TMEM256/DUF423 family)
MDARRTLFAAGLLIALATALGALGSHALKQVLPPDRLNIYETAVRYHFYHALGLLALGILLRNLDSGLLRAAAIIILSGILLFSGSLYLLAFGWTAAAPRVIGILTPLGGLALIVGWVAVAVSVVRT